jgi:polyisoprenoid-binding protein YceI
MSQSYFRLRPSGGLAAAALVACLLVAPAAAQAPTEPPGRPNAAAVVKGRYEVDGAHTQVVWSLDHQGFSRLYGMWGGMTGTLTLDPANPAAAKLVMELPISGLTVTSPAFAEHLRDPRFFDAAKFPSARFESTSVRPNGMKATVTGNLTLHGVTKPVELAMTLTGSGVSPMNKAVNVGFYGTARLKRSDWGLGLGVPVVSDDVDLQITGAFVRVGE